MEFQQDTKYRILKFDCENLAQTLTTDLLGPLVQWNYPGLPFGVRWKFDLDKPDPKSRLDAAKTIWEMGVSLDEDEVRGDAGYSKPKEGALVLKKPDPGAGGMPGEDGPAGAGQLPMDRPTRAKGEPKPGQPGQPPPQQPGQEPEVESPEQYSRLVRYAAMGLDPAAEHRGLAGVAQQLAAVAAELGRVCQPVVVNVPQQPAPVVNVETAQPEIVVNVPAPTINLPPVTVAAPPPVVHIDLPPRRTRTLVRRDEQGLIQETQAIEE